MATFAGSSSSTGSGQTRFQRSPTRGTPSGRSSRTTAGSHRIPVGGSGLSARPLRDLPRVAAYLKAETSRLPPTLVRDAAMATKAILDQEGGRYKLRGYNGERVPLRAETQRSRQVLGRKGNGRAILGAATANMTVSGVPAGFWRIVEEGSGRHLIAGRRRRNGRRMTSKGAMSGFLRASQRGDSFNIGTPILLKPGSKGSGGWRQWADHPGHGPIGAPWKRGVEKSRIVVQKMHDDHISRTLRTAFLR